jgi:hypothetical protein
MPDHGTPTRFRNELLGIYRRSLAQVESLMTDVLGGEEDWEATAMLAVLVTLGPRPTEDYDVEADRLATALEDLYDEDSPEYVAAMERARFDPLFFSRIAPVVACYQEMVRAYEQFRDWSQEEASRALDTDPTLRATLFGARTADYHEHGRQVGAYAHAWSVCYQFLMSHQDGARMLLEVVLDDDDDED